MPPISPPNPNIGDLECGNWGVFGTLTLGAPGLASTCNCMGTGMTGSRCHVECESDAQCGTGVCNTEVGRCECTDRCFIDNQCEWGSCVSGVCTNGWTDVGCARALSGECNEDSDCSGHGTCGDGTCVCDQGYIGGRCEKQLAGTGEACTYSSDCKDSIVNDVCVENVCQEFGNECRTHDDCKVTCRGGLCTFPTIPPEISDQELTDKLGMMVEEMLTPEGVAMLLSEEGVEKVISTIPKALAAAYTQIKLRDKLMVGVVKKAIARRSATVSVEGLAPAASRGIVSSMVKNFSNQATRSAVKAAAVKMGKLAASRPAQVLFFAIQAVGVILDVDDAAGFNAQVTQDHVDMYMKKMLSAINDFDDLKDAGVQFPREYLPESTIEYRAKVYGGAAEDRKIDIMLDYIDHLDVNSNGATIIRDWTPPSAAALPGAKPSPNKVLWTLSGKNTKTYESLSKYWWAILILVCVIILTLGLGIGLAGRRKRNKKD